MRVLHLVDGGQSRSFIGADESHFRARWIYWFGLFFLGLAALPGVQAEAQTATPVNVPTWRYDNTHAGSNTQETLLTPANVSAATFGKLFGLSVDGYVYAQPLYVSGLTMPDGHVHNVLFVATEHDSVYAFDADSNGGTNASPLWQASMLSTAHGAAAGATTVPNGDLGTTDIVPEVGITATPVIDVAAQTIFLVAKTKENGAYVQRLHALSLITGAERNGSPSAPIAATVSGSGTGSSGGLLSFSSEWQNNRVALNLFNGYVYVAWGAHGDNGPWHGWLITFNEQTLAQVGAVSLSPNGYGNGLWASGAGFPIDTVSANGRLFTVAGNGDYTSYPPLNNTVDFGDSIVRYDLTGGLPTPTDAFTPFNQATLTGSDQDQGSGGVLLLPNQAGTYPHELVQVGKEGRILVLNRDNLGGYAPGGSKNPNVLQDIPNQIAGLWSTPAYWNGHVYFWGSGDTLKRFDLASGVLSATPSSVAAVGSAFPGASPVISSNGTTNGVLWAVRSDAYNSNGSEVLYAFDPNNLGTVLYESDTNAAQDDAGPANKFAVPVVTNGKVYVGAAYQVDVYGLTNGQQRAAAPVITPNGGLFSSAQQVSLSTTTPNGAIYYTTDGSLPSPAAILYSAPFTVSADTTVRAIVSAQNYLQSPVSAAVFTFASQTPPPTFTPAGGSYASTQTVTITDSAAGARIYYTTDGSTPTTASAVYTAPITVGTTETVNAIAISGTLSASNLVSSAYEIKAGSTGINFGSGFASVAGLTLNGSAINSNDSRLQLTNGGTYQAGSVFSNTPLNISSFTNDFSFQLSLAQADGFTFTIESGGPTALGPGGGGLGYGPDAAGGTGGIPHSVAIKFDLYSNAGEGPDSTGLYQNGASPTVPAIDMTSSGINLHSGDAMSVHMTYDGTTLIMTITDAVTAAVFTHSFTINIPQVIGTSSAYLGFTGGTGGLTASQKILTWTFASGYSAAAALPVISPNGGSFTTPQQVSISDATANSTIHYTTDGTTPTISSPAYAAPFTISSGTVTVNAIATSATTQASPVASATFTVTLPQAAAPTFSLAGGNYVGSQSVTLSDVTSGAVIYYTTDGTKPGLSSKAYSGAITVAATETISAIAVAPNYSQSPVAAATYTIYAAGQTISYPSGFTSSAGFAFNGSAKLNTTLNSLELTDGNGNETSSLWFTTPVNVSAFTSDFTFQMSNAVADGFTFALQSNGTTALGAYGGGLGYQGILRSFALKFDLYNNAGEGTDSIGVYTGGAAPTVPATNLTGTGIVLTSGDTFQVHLVYNGTVLQVTLTDTKTSATYSTSFTVDIPGALGTSAGYAGFTGGTGGGTVSTNISNWTYTPAGAPAAAEPTFNPAPGSYVGPVSVSLSDLTPNSTIYYTVDGSQPSHASAVYSGPIQVSGVSLTIKAFASAAGLTDSPVVIGTFTLQQPAAAPVFQLAPGTYAGTQTVSITDAAAGASIYYTVQGATPTTSSTLYAGPITVSASETIKAIAVASGYTQSAVASASYIITSLAATPVISPASGSYSTIQSATITDSMSGSVIYYTLNGVAPTTSSARYTGPISIAKSVNLQAIAIASGYLQSNVASAAYTISLAPAATPAFDLAPGSYVGTQTLSITDSTPGAVIYYTLQGATPTTSSTRYTGPVSLPITATVKAIAVATGYTQSAVASGVYTITPQPAATPLLSLASGAYTGSQSVTITDATAGAVIYYTLNGAPPTTSSTRYTGPITVSTTLNLQAIAIASGYAQSSAASAAYTIQ